MAREDGEHTHDLPGADTYDRLEVAANKLARIVDRRWLTMLIIGVVSCVAALAAAIGASLALGNTTELKHIARRSEDTQIAQACSTASTRKFPRLLSDNVELAKALEYSVECNRLNGVKAFPIKLP